MVSMTQNTNKQDDRPTDRNSQRTRGVLRRPLGTAWIVIAYRHTRDSVSSRGDRPMLVQVLCPRNSLSTGTGVKPLDPTTGARYPVLRIRH